MWFDSNNYYYGDNQKNSKDEEDCDLDLKYSQRVCVHSWTPIVLISSTVYNCSKCDIKKEEYEKLKARNINVI